MNKLFLSLALLVVVPAFVFAAEPAKPAANATVEAPKAKTADEAAKFAKDAVHATVDTVGAEFRAKRAFLVDAASVTAKALADADKAVTENKDEVKKAGLEKVAAAAKVANEEAQKAITEFTKDNTGVVAFVKAQFDKLGLTVVAHPWIAAATVAAMTVAIVEAIHFLASSEADEEAQF